MNEALLRQGTARRILAKVVTALENISSAVILVMMLLTFADVIGRYVFIKPIFGASEMISALLALAIFAGLGVTNARDEHIVVELFDHEIKRIFSPLTYEIIIQAFSVIAMTIIAFVLYENALDAYHINSQTVVLEMPTYYITGTVALLALISVVSQITGVILKIIDTKHPTQDGGV
jgi:TRAP-type C4-dicarboxylate transport system permease small subunit